MRVCLLLLWLLLLPFSARAEKVSVLALNAPPYVVVSENGRVSGSFAEVVRSAFAASGLEVEFASATWGNIAHAVARGTASVAMPVVKTRERREYARFSQAVMQARTVLFSLSHWTGSSHDPVFGVVGHVSIGVAPGEECRSLMVRLPGTVVRMETILEALQHLVDGSVQYVAMDELAGWRAIDRLYPGQRDLFVSSRDDLETRELCVMFSRADPEADRLQAAFNSGLMQLREKGDLAVFSDDSKQ